MMLLDTVNAMKHSPLHHYAGVPGLTSWMIAKGQKGIVRLLECSRDHYEPVTPHSHRFDFTCQVLAGSVRNILWTPSATLGDEYQATTILYEGKPGKYALGGKREVKRFQVTEHRYDAGGVYSMRADDIHSIYFKRGTSVLFFEGDQVSDSSVILEPVVNGVVVNTFEVPKWAFRKAAA